MRSGMPILPMSCNGADLNKQLDGVGVEESAEARMLAQMFGQHLDVVLGAADVVAGLVVTRLGQRGHGVDRDILDRAQLARAALDFLFQVLVLVAQEVGRVFDLELGAYARQHHGRADRFGDVIGRAQLQTVRLVLAGGHSGQEDDGYVARGRVALQCLRHFVAGHPRHHDVKQDEVGRRCIARDAQCFLAVIRCFDRITILEQVGHQQKIIRRVVHDKDYRPDGTGIR